MLASRSVQRAIPYGRQDKQQRLRPSSSPRAVTTHNQDVCGSDNQRKISTEMNFHFPGYEGLDKPADISRGRGLLGLRFGGAYRSGS